MTRQFADSQSTSIEVRKDNLIVPSLFRSSEESNWEGVVLRAFHEPAKLDGLIGPVVSDTSLVLITCGAMYMEQRLVNGPWRAQHVRQGDLFLAPGGVGPYEVRWKSLSPEPLQTLHLHLNNDLLARTVEEVAGYDPAHLDLLGRFGFQDPLLTQIALALWQELELDTPAGKLYAQTAAQMLAVHLLRHYTSTESEVKEVSQRLTRHQIKRVTDFILAHLSQDLSLDALAQQIGFSPYHFARLFRQTTGESPHQFVLRLRIERAQRLLKETDIPLAHVALECGFANQSHLSLAFKRHLGLTPRAYRQDR
jgi:AraC family transcriptional regulator